MNQTFDFDRITDAFDFLNPVDERAAKEEKLSIYNSARMAEYDDLNNLMSEE
jgi:hypothetical protein